MEKLTDNSVARPNLSGVNVGDYRLLRRLGSGGMSDVYLAVQESLKRNVALKLLREDLAQNDDYVARFKREAQAAAALVHANIVQIFEVGEVDGFHFIAQEYVRGRNLKQYLGRYGAVAPDMALSVLRQATMALQKGADHEVVHRDIKPENIMLTANGEIKIADFGLARVGKQKDKTLTQAGITVGTPLYMSPEQIEGNEVDIRSDIYSLGVTVYHMIVGEPPFDGESPLSIAIKHATQEPEPISSHREDLPEGLADVVAAMLQKKKEDRPQTPVQLLRMLQPISVEQSNGFDWSLFEVQPSEVEGPLAKTVGFEQPVTELLVQKPSWLRKNAGWLPWVLCGILSMASFWGGTQIANQFSGLKNQKMQVATVVDEEVPLECDVEEQYLAAYWATKEVPEDDFSKQEMLWQAVLEYFPSEEATVEVAYKTQLYNLRAKCRLGEIYIQSGELDKATAVYDELAEQEELALEFRTTGLAGRAITLKMRPLDYFKNGGAQEQQSLIRLCLDAESGGVRQNKELLNKFLRDRVEGLLDEYKSYGKYMPPPATDFARRHYWIFASSTRS